MRMVAAVLSACLTAACGVSDARADRSRLDPLHGPIDPETLTAPAAAPVAPAEEVQPVGEWRVSNVIDGRTIELYRGLERATASLGGIAVPVDDECLAQLAADSLTFITGGGRQVVVSPPTARQNRILDATILTADGDDVTEAMLSLGLARVDDDAGTPRSSFEEFEAEARRQSLGIWSDDCDDDE